MSTPGKKIRKLSEETIYLGLGIASLAKDEIEGVVSYLSQKGKPLAKDYGKTKSKLIENGKKKYESIKALTEKSLLSASEKLAKTAHAIGGKRSGEKSTPKKTHKKKLSGKK